ncbi:MAG: sensor domain-containing diguanylate cyclase [Bacillota bacterium]|nr:sensor domain-containing diguanylate cyclase [Bacillota bacterium]
MTPDQLFDQLITYVMSDLTLGKEVVEQLMNERRYRDDFEFRLLVECADCVIRMLRGEYHDLITIVPGIIERAKALRMLQCVSMLSNQLGGAYYYYGLYERAFETYRNIILSEREQGILSMTSTAYANIALIFRSISALKEARRYMELAMESFERAGTEQSRYRSKFVYLISDLIELLVQTNQMERAKEEMARLDAFDKTDIARESLYSYNLAKVYFAFWTGDYAEARSRYYEAISFLDSYSDFFRERTLCAYIDLCVERKLDYSLYREELLQVEELKGFGYPIHLLNSLKELRKYYYSVGDLERAQAATDRYLGMLESLPTYSSQRQLAALQVVEEILDTGDSYSEITSKNTELELIADEAIRHKNALQEAYYHIEMTNEIGRKLTSSLNLVGVIEGIYRSLRANIPMTVFLLMVAEPEQNRLRSVACYSSDELRSEFTVALDNPHSLLAECYRTKQIMVTGDLFREEERQREILYLGDGNVHSLVFMPLMIEDKVIGICSLQDVALNVYNEKRVEFLEGLQPYLAIALNNAMRSWHLEREIRSHKKTQAKLEEVNRRLELLSSLDGLTQISNRRDFEMKFIRLIQRAHHAREPVCVFMLDIDNFKLYNDTYGHLEGDEALKQIAQVIRRNLDHCGGLSARFGGEEFIGACRGLDAAAAKRLAERIRQDVYDLKIPNEKAPLKILTISTGVAVSHTVDEGQKSRLMRVADESLYQAKDAGKNCVILKELVLD